MSSINIEKRRLSMRIKDKRGKEVEREDSCMKEKTDTNRKPTKKSGNRERCRKLSL
jgi:hypothetical protein